MYEKCISLGATCTPAWQIRNYCHLAKAYPFDWLVTSFGSLIEVIESDFEKFVDCDDLQVIRDGGTVLNTRYNLLHHHDFQRISGKIDPGWKSSAVEVASKYEYLANRWRSLSEYEDKVLFVRHQGHLDADFKYLSPLVEDDMHILQATLSRRFPRLDFDILFVTAGSSPTESARLYHATVPYANEADWPNPDDRWKGATADWDRLLTDFAVKR
ncbi:MAG: DUF1796 family putative cysteine peptidase [Hyphomicrobiales bacterium]|nr:DUF1796 family putative cysteine peptidase [Hyphomicrobiales bacterium]